MDLKKALAECKKGKSVSCQKLITKFHCSYLWYYDETGDFYGGILYKGVNDKYMSESDLNELKNEEWVIITIKDTDKADYIMQGIFNFLDGMKLVTDSENDKITITAIKEGLNYDNHVTRHIFPRNGEW